MKPISKTAFYCCGVRMEDAARPDPVCGDGFAQRFMDEHGHGIYAQFKTFKYPNGSNVTRHRIIDDWLRRELAANPELTVALIGAGFDSRAFRLSGGRWLELDEPQVLDYKEQRLPAAECPNPLQRIPIDFAAERLADKLAPYAGRRPVAVVMEGVIMYLEAEALDRTLTTLRDVFPGHKLVCDLMTRRFFDKYSRPIHDKIRELGAAFSYTVERPEQIFIERGYRLLERISIPLRAAELGAVNIPRLLIRWVMGTLREGYRIHIFQAP